MNGGKPAARSAGEPVKNASRSMQAALNGSWNLAQSGPERSDGSAGAHAARGIGVRNLAFDDDEHAAVADEAVVREDEALLAAVRAVRRRQVEAVDGREGKPGADVVELLGLEAATLQREPVQAGLAIRELVIAVDRAGSRPSAAVA